ncbi:MAG: type II secretion system protein N [Sphingomonadales bacterium]|nr:type II secretion system protein N [Sphingomonadales bacterium]MDE2568137.1 type II secretion system protein N [Sphingomonadales bacterium]
MSRHAIAVLAALFVVFLIAMFPLRIALGWAGAGRGRVTAQAVQGSIWSGRIGALNVGPLPLGTVDAGLKPLPLLLGRAEVWVERSAGANEEPFRAIASGSGGDLSLRHVNGTLPLAGTAGALPVDAVGFSEFAIEMRGGKCESAEGTVSLRIAPVSALLPDALSLSGQARCQDGALAVPMRGPTGMEQLLFKAQGDGKWTADLVLTGLPVEVSGPLLDMGFSARGGGGIGLRAGGSL